MYDRAFAKKARQSHFVGSPASRKCRGEAKAWAKIVLLREIGAAALFSAIFSCLFYLTAEEKTPTRLWTCVGLFAFLTLISAVGSIKRHKGMSLQPSRRAYSYEKESQLKRLHTYSSHNRKWVDTSVFCHCFYCKRQVRWSTIEW